MTELVIKGAEDLEKLGRALKQVGDRELRKELLAALRAATKPMKEAVQASARENLPSRGGFADLVAASRFTTKNRLSGKNVGMRFEAKNRHEIKALDRGRLRHPLYGNKEHWYTQTVTAGWFSTPIEEMSQEIRVEVSEALARVAEKFLDKH